MRRSHSDGASRRRLIGNMMNLLRTTRGRNLIFTSEAHHPLDLRSPYDIINL